MYSTQRPAFSSFSSSNNFNNICTHPAAFFEEADIVTASVEELDAEFSAVHVPEFLDGSNEGPVVLYPDGVEPLDAREPLLANAIRSSAESPMKTDTAPSNTFISAVLYDEDHRASCVLDLETADDDETCVLPASIPPLRNHLMWPCLVDGPVGPPARTHALIDHGCPTVLISSKLQMDWVSVSLNCNSHLPWEELEVALFLVQITLNCMCLLLTKSGLVQFEPLLSRICIST